jgi:hypothetical protein
MKSRSTDVPEGPQDHCQLPAEWQTAIDSCLEFRRVHRGVSSSTLKDDRRLLGQFAQHMSPPGLPGRPPASIVERH